jgi:hypothetical protein
LEDEIGKITGAIAGGYILAHTIKVKG